MSRQCAPSAAGAWRKLRGRARGVERAGRRPASPPRSTPARSSSRARAPASRRSRSTGAVCVVGPGTREPFAEYRIERAALMLTAEGAPAPPAGAPRPASSRGGPAAARRARAPPCSPPAGPPRPASRRSSRPRTWPGERALADELERVAERGCDVYLVELKAGRDRHRRHRRRRPRAPRSCSCATGRSVRGEKTRCSNCGGMPPATIVVHKGHGLPDSKGLMAQSLSAAGSASSAPSSSRVRSSAGWRCAATARWASTGSRRSASRCCARARGRAPCGDISAGAGSTGSTGRSSC